MYKIIGGDGKEYGPISADQLRQWIIQSRVNRTTQIKVEGSAEWKPLSAFPRSPRRFPGRVVLQAPRWVQGGGGQP